MKQHRLYLISGGAEVRVRSIALITCRMTNEAGPGVKGGRGEKVRERKELADCGTAVQGGGRWEDPRPDEGHMPLFLFLVFFFPGVSAFSLAPRFFFFLRSLYIPGSSD